MKTNTKKGIALVVSNAEYEFQPKLPSCKKDGIDMKNALEKLNFDVLFAADTKRNDLFEIIDKFLRCADLYSVLVVYYTGHGVQIDGENYFVPVDCRYNNTKSIFIGSSLVGINTITDYMENNGHKTNIMILDACRTSPGFSKSIVGKGLAEVTAGSGTFIGFATAPNTEAYGTDSDRGNSYYTEGILNNIFCPNITIEETFKRVRNDVMSMTQSVQVPWESTSLNSDFYFNTMSDDEIKENIYQAMRNFYCANTLLELNKLFGYSISDLMRIYEKQKSEKPGGLYINNTEDFEYFILQQILELGFEFKNYRWVYNNKSVVMGEFYHNFKKI